MSQIDEGPVTVRKSASIKAVACTEAWVIMTAGVQSHGGEIHAVAALNKQPEPHHREITRAYNTFESVGITEEQAKNVLKVQQSTSPTDGKLADAKIADQVKAAVRRDPDVRTVDVVVLVSGGVVTLSGTVTAPHQRSQAENLASEVDGFIDGQSHRGVERTPVRPYPPIRIMLERPWRVHCVKQGHCRQPAGEPMFLARYLQSVLLIVLFSLAVAAEARGQELLREEEKTGGPRFKHSLGLYEPSYGIYDEILERTEPGPESLREVLKLPSWLIVGGQHRTRYETLNGRWRAGERGADQQLALRTRLFFAVQDIFDPLRATVELQDSRVHLTDSGSFVTEDQVNKTEIQQLHLDLVSANFLGTGQPTILSIGRINMDIGRRRWVARNSFRNTTQAFDGVHWRVGDEKRWHVRAFLVEPVDILPERLDKAAPAQRNTLWGLYVESRRLPWVHAAFHYFGHRSAGPHRDFDMLGLRLFRPGEAGTFQYEIESSYQFGDISSAGKFAHFQHGEIGYTFEATWTPQVLVRFDYAGRGFDTLYGARSFELIPTGIFGPFERSNIISPGYRIMITPTERMSLFVQHRAWWLADDEGPWVGSGLQDPTGRPGRFIGQTVELRARWGLIENVYVQAGYVHFAYGSYPSQVPGGPIQDHADYAYVQAELMF